jgi:endogenous inhibitor of DNA gyrase (YacG/DUF329 family)
LASSSSSEAKRPIQKDFHYNVTMSGSGDFNEQKLVCPYCGAPVERGNIKVMSGGLVIECPYCDRVSQMEEDPKW